MIRSLLAMATLARCGDTVGAASDVVARSETVLSLLESKAAGRAMRQDVADALRRELPFADVVAWRLAVGVRRQSAATFLRGARPNPSTRGDWSLEHRHAEGGPWTLVATASSRRAMADEIAAGARRWPVDAAPGDLARLLGSDGRVQALYGLDRAEALRALPTPRWTFSNAAQVWVKGLSWPQAWAQCPSAARLLRAVGPHVPRVVLVRAAAACARESQPLLRDDPARSARMLDDVDAWVAAEGAPARVVAARMRAEFDAVPYFAEPAAAAVVQVVRAALLVHKSAAASEAGTAAARVAEAFIRQNRESGFGDNVDGVHARLVAIVRREIPLAVLVESLLGARTP